MGPTGTTKKTLLATLNGERQPVPPIWLMRQAGRYLPEYNATRAKAGSFLKLAKSPALATEVALQPLDRYALDAARAGEAAGLVVVARSIAEDFARNPL